jgi:hypothetical protein
MPKDRKRQFRLLSEAFYNWESFNTKRVRGVWRVMSDANN